MNKESFTQQLSRSLLFIIVLNLSGTIISHGKSPMELRLSIYKILEASHATVGVGIAGLDFKESLTLNNDHHYPMQSVYKFPLALAILHQVYEKQLALDEKIHMPRQSLNRATWSPMVKDFPDQDIDLTLRDLLIYTISKSDNNACDVLFHLAGGTATV